VAPRFDAYRQAVWLILTDGSREPRQLTYGPGRDHRARFSPDGRFVAFLSDRGACLEPEAPDTSRVSGAAGARGGQAAKERDDAWQVYVLPLDGGEARRLTDLPRGVEAFEWSPDGTRLVVVSASRGATRVEDARRRGIPPHEPDEAPPPSDYRFVDRLDYMLNGKGFVYDRVPHLWIVDVATGAASRLTDGPVADREPTWSPDGRRIAFSSNRRRDADLFGRQDIHVVDVATQRVTAVTRGPRSVFGWPVFLPDGATIAALGHRQEGRAGSRNDIWLFAADGSDASPTGGRNLSGAHDLMPGSTMNSDVTAEGGPQLVPSSDGRWISFTAPIDGAYELWRIAIDDGRHERLTDGRHYVSGWDSQAGRIAFLRSTPTEPAELSVLDVDTGTSRRRGPGSPRRLTAFNAELLAEVELHEPQERVSTVDGRRIQGWFLPAADDGADRPGAAKPLVVEIHGGPHTLYGWSPFWEFQLLAASGIGVFYCNPRGSEGYGQAFNDANHRDWGHGPMRDILAGVDALVADGLADPDRLGVTGGSYGGYMTNWIVAHDHRFRAAMTCRSVSDMTMLFLTGDISGGDWANMEFDATPWSDPAYYREISPISYAGRIRTPLLIQHSENDIRTTIGQAEALFTVLRSHRRPVRLMRVPAETHDLTRSGTPFRRVENVRIVVDWFRHFLVDGKRGLPPLPKVRGGR
jgi:dipeptidyl aminopeptidase/acylaminoacyl peptidase